MRLGSLTVIAFVFVSAFARVWSPAVRGLPASRTGTGTGTSAGSGDGSSTDQRKGDKQNVTDKQPYTLALKEKIRDFFREEPPVDQIGGAPCRSNDYWCVPVQDRTHVRFIIATAPDPVHTHLSLFFDRTIDSIVEGIGTQGYLLDRALMPWHYSGNSRADEGSQEDKIRESYPGLMIFRRGAAVPLFVFVVGEAPTSGINEEQFRHAVDIIRDIRKDHPNNHMSRTTPEFGILGPTFSGSLYSLSVILRSDDRIPHYADSLTLPVYSIAIGTPSIMAFQTSAPETVRLSIFQEDAESIFQGLLTYVDSLHYRGSDIAVLSEDETAYGESLSLRNRQKPKESKERPVSQDENAQPLNLEFPRGISQFRSQYSSQVATTTGEDETGDTNGRESRNLRSDLQVTGSDDDSVAPYNRVQTPLSQEGVMLSILSELRSRQPKFILLQASDPLDELFLAQYLRDKYPQGRLVVPTPDLLFPRDESGELNGVLGLNTYPLSPGEANPRCVAGTGPLLFPSSAGAAVYNAASMLARRLDLDRVPVNGDSADQKLEVPLCITDVVPKMNFFLGISKNLWLTIVSGSSIHPIKVISVPTPAPFYPAAAMGTVPKENDQRISRIPATWWFPYALCLALLGVHIWVSWKGGSLVQWTAVLGNGSTIEDYRRKSKILWIGTITVVAIYAALASANTPVLQNKRAYQWLLSIGIWLPLAGFVCWARYDFMQRRKERVLFDFVAFTAIIGSAAYVQYAFHMQDEMVLWQQRTLDLTSGISPVTPLLLLLIAVYVWFAYSLHAESLVDWRCPQLPDRAALPSGFDLLSNTAADHIRKVMRPLSGRAIIIGSIAVLCLAIPWTFISPGNVPIRSLEGRTFDVAYSVLLGCALVILVATLLQVRAVWLSLRQLLMALNRVGFRNTLQRLSGFEWTVIWNPTWNMQAEAYKCVSREVQAIERLEKGLGSAAPGRVSDIKTLREHIVKIKGLRDKLREVLFHPARDHESRMLAVAEPFKQINAEFAATAGFLVKEFLEIAWQHFPAADESGRDAGSAPLRVGANSQEDRPPQNPSGLSVNSIALAEEFVGCVYSSFLVTVLLRIRGLVFSTVAIYACVVFSTISYPFQPGPQLNTLAIALFLLCGLVIVYIYEEMHRDGALSRMTSSTPGKLDGAFWSKFASAGILPLIALVTTVYPPFGHFLYSLAGPLLQALR